MNRTRRHLAFIWISVAMMVAYGLPLLGQGGNGGQGGETRAKLPKRLRLGSLAATESVPTKWIRRNFRSSAPGGLISTNRIPP